MPRVFWITAVLAFALDQLSKVIVVHWMNLRSLGEIEVLPPLVTFRMAWNRGVNFGLFQSGDTGRWVLVVLSIAICIWVVVWLRKLPFVRMAWLGAGLLVGGALGNVIDRVIYGAVADFLNMSCCGFDNPFSFNIADASIFVGAVLLVIFSSDKKQT